ncbi:MAG: lytic transglycosylase domain-containing protein [Candidatus Rokubacteria bacterium]|nr:lytic transglycosylase domain-containing protein [Candidatus Rokubacteria bacterium]
MSCFACLCFAVALLWTALPAGAETFRFVAPDGTIHFTNAPTDPRYQRLGLVPSPLPTPSGDPFRQTWREAPRYRYEIQTAAARYGIAEELISAVIRVESGFNPRAVSRKGARGLMQLMPETASVLGVRDTFNPRENIDGGVRHLRGLIERFANDVVLALAAYNAGEQAVLAYGGIPPFPETRDYVNRVLLLFEGAAGVTRPRLPRSALRRLERDGTVVYTNLPSSGRL